MQAANSVSSSRPQRALSPAPPRPQPSGKYFCGCQYCLGLGRIFVSKNTWIRHEDVREQEIAEGISRPPHPSYKKPIETSRKRTLVDDQMENQNSSSGTVQEREEPAPKRLRHDTSAHAGVSVSGGSSRVQVIIMLCRL